MSSINNSQHNKVILIVLDGLASSVARHGLGYIEGLVEAQQAAYHEVRCELPSSSRPLYETILTGYSPVESGITTNGINRLSQHDSIFHIASKAGLVTATSSYHWISELYTQCPYNIVRDRFQ